MMVEILGKYIDELLKDFYQIFQAWKNKMNVY